MTKLATTLAGLVLLACIFGVNPQPLQNHLLTIAYIFPKSFIFNLSVTLSLLLFSILKHQRRIHDDSTTLHPPKIVDLMAGVYLIVGLMSSALYPTSVTFLLQWLTMVLPVMGLAWIASQAISTQREQNRIVHWMLTAAAIVVIFAIYDALGGVLPWKLIKRPTGILGTRSDVAAFCVVSLPVAISCLHTDLKDLKSHFRVLGLALLILGLMCSIVLCRSRASWVGLGVMGCFYGVVISLRRFKNSTASTVLFDGPKYSSVAVMMGLLLCGAFAAVQIPWPGLRWTEQDPFKSSALRIFEYDRGTGLGRIYQYQIAQRMVAERPLLGFGPGAWRREVARFVEKVPDAPEDIFAHTNLPNSELIPIVTETGVLGLACLLVLFGLLVGSPTIAFVQGKSGRSMPFVCSFVGFGAMAFLDSMSVRPEILAFMGIAAAVLRTESLDSQMLPWHTKIAVLRTASQWVTPFLYMTALLFAALQTYGNFVFLTGRLPLSLEAVPDFVPWPHFGMNALSFLEIPGPDPCARSRRSFARAIALTLPRCPCCQRKTHRLIL